MDKLTHDLAEALETACRDYKTLAMKVGTALHDPTIIVAAINFQSECENILRVYRAQLAREKQDKEGVIHQC